MAHAPPDRCLHLAIAAFCSSEEPDEALQRIICLRTCLFLCCRSADRKTPLFPLGTILVSGFSVLQVQGPCPFRIEVTNSFVQPHPPMVSVALEATLAANRIGTGNAGKSPPNPSCAFFGSMSCETGGRACAGKQRAPINTTPNLAVRTAKP